MRVVLNGCGAISSLWLDAISQNTKLELVGLVDIAPEAAERQREAYGLDIAIGDTLAAMLVRTQPDIVFDCSIPSAHPAVTLTALEHGCHIFGEKPMAESLSQAQSMRRAAQQAGKVYAVMQNRRFDPNLRSIQRLLASGLLGDITSINADFFLAAHFGGFREQMQHVLLQDMSIHHFDMARFLCGRNAESVYCLEWNPADSWYSNGASAQAIVTMQGGVVFNYRGSWCSEGLHTPWQGQWRIIGTCGSLSWDGDSGLHCEVVKQTGGFISEHEQPSLPSLQPQAPRDWHRYAIDHFVEALEQNKTPETVCDDNIHSLAMVFAAIASAQSQQLVQVESLFASN